MMNTSCDMYSDNDDLSINQGDGGDDEVTEEEESFIAPPPAIISRLPIPHVYPSCTNTITPPVPKDRKKGLARTILDTNNSNNGSSNSLQRNNQVQQHEHQLTRNYTASNTVPQGSSNPITTICKNPVPNYGLTMFQKPSKMGKLLNSFSSCSYQHLTFGFALILLPLLAYLISTMHQLQYSMMALQQQHAEHCSEQLTREALKDVLNEFKRELIDGINSADKLREDALKYMFQTEFQKLNSKSDPKLGIPPVEPESKYQIMDTLSSLFQFRKESSADSDSSSKIQNVKQELESMKASYFPNQPHETWMQIYSAVASTLEATSSESSAPPRPAIILILQKPSEETSTDFGSCFTNMLAKTLNKATGNRKIKTIGPNYFTSFSSPTEIHEDLEHHLQYHGKIILVSDVHQIQLEQDLLIFHSFCDNYMAPDPKAIFLFFVTIPETEFNWEHWNGGRIANEFLSKVWRDALTEDKRAALIARLAPSVVLIQNNPDDNSRLNSGVCNLA